MAKSYVGYDPEKANQLLDEMGLDKWDSDHNYRLRLNSKSLKVIVDVLSEGELHYMSVTELVKEYWENVGVGVSIMPFTW